MATLTITIPDEHVTRVLDAFAAEYGYDRYVETGGTMTKGEFAKAKVVQYMKDVVSAAEGRAAAEAAVAGIAAPPALD